MSFDGGYYLIRQDLMRGGPHQHTAAHPEEISDKMIEAGNLIQSTAWMINTWILDLMREAWVAGDLIGGLPSPYDEPLPPRHDDEVWDAMSKEARAEYKYSLSKIHERNAKREGKRKAYLSKIEIAESLRNQPAIYFPHFMDFRGRFYPMSQDLNPQGDDIAKSLLQFSKGLPLGKRGLRWLAIRLANSYGQDKLTFDERIEWVHDHLDLIFDSAVNPLDGERFWAATKPNGDAVADEPWGFLATCREFYEAWHSPDPEQFLSHLPIPLDGTCNGLQHLSMMGLDPVGAKATNCSADPQRYDLYSEVAEVVDRLVKSDAAEGLEEAHHWIIRGVDRGVVKRAVMTTPYGVTPRGIQDQLLSDGIVGDMPGLQGPNAAYMRDKIIQALSTTVHSAKEIMAYFQSVALALAEEERPLRWRTPADMIVTQSYYNLARKRIRSLAGRFIMWDEDEDMGLNRRKQFLSAAPNIIHSFDAAMLARTALRCQKEHGLADFAFIHDSYGTHACNTDLLADTLREEAYQIYSTNRLQEFHDFVSLENPGVVLPAPPDRGDFDISEVLRSPYFFA